MKITNITGSSEVLSGYTNLAIKQAVKGDISLSFLLPKTEQNTHAFDLVEEESVLTYNGIDYRIKQCAEKLVGVTPVKSVTAPHVFFDLIDDFRYDTLTTGFKSINVIFDFIFRDTGWTFSIIDSFDTEEFENFGNDNCISLFKNALDRFEAEYEIAGGMFGFINRSAAHPIFNSDIITMSKRLEKRSTARIYQRIFAERGKRTTKVIRWSRRSIRRLLLDFTESAMRRFIRTRRSRIKRR